MEIKKFRPESITPIKVQNPTEGVMTPTKLKEETINILLERLKDEYGAHYYYRAYC
jgi:hypothetical protein